MTFYCDDDIDNFEEGCMCPRCSGMGTISCHCGGDLCVCLNYGERDCPLCRGESTVSPTTYDAYMEEQRKAYAAFHGITFTYPHETKA